MAPLDLVCELTNEHVPIRPTCTRVPGQMSLDRTSEIATPDSCFTPKNPTLHLIHTISCFVAKRRIPDKHHTCSELSYFRKAYVAPLYNTTQQSTHGFRRFLHRRPSCQECSPLHFLQACCSAPCQADKVSIACRLCLFCTAMGIASFVSHVHARIAPISALLEPSSIAAWWSIARRDWNTARYPPALYSKHQRARVQVSSHSLFLATKNPSTAFLTPWFAILPRSVSVQNVAGPGRADGRPKELGGRPVARWEGRRLRRLRGTHCRLAPHFHHHRRPHPCRQGIGPARPRDRRGNPILLCLPPIIVSTKRSVLRRVPVPKMF